MSDKDQIVVSLCDKSGNVLWPWARAGYDCYAVDIENNRTRQSIGDGTIYFIESDVRDWNPIHGGNMDTPNVRIGFGWPPCTDLAVSGARWMQDKGLLRLAEAIEIVGTCHQLLTSLDCPWMIENPVSTLSTYWREPDYRFDPYEYNGYTSQDEAYTKETWLWAGGGFKMPPRNGVSESDADNRIHQMPPSEDRAEKRAVTPTGFAEAVYQVHDGNLEPRSDSGYEQETLLQTDGGCKARSVGTDSAP